MVITWLDQAHRCGPSGRNRKKVQNRAARFVTSNYCFETGSMTGIPEKIR